MSEVSSSTDMIRQLEIIKYTSKETAAIYLKGFVVKTSMSDVTIDSLIE